MASFNFNFLSLPTLAVDNRSTQPYWQLPTFSDIRLPDLKRPLQDHNVSFKSGATHKRCELLLQRAERGLMSYGDCPISELQRLVQQRAPEKEPPTTHTRLVRLLEKMDNEAKFERFLELPAEMRNMIYEFHLKDLGVLKATNRPRERRSGSPVLVKRVVREEAMPLFNCKRRLRHDTKR